MSKLTTTDIDHLTAGMFIFIHAAERMVNQMSLHYETIDRDSQEYKRLCKLEGKIVADQWVHEQNKQILLQVKGQMLRRWLDAAHRLIAATDQATEVGLMSKQDGVSEVDISDALILDSNMMCRLFLLLGNINPKDYGKLEKVMKDLTDKDHHPVRRILVDMFRPSISGGVEYR